MSKAIDGPCIPSTYDSRPTSIAGPVAATANGPLAAAPRLAAQRGRGLLDRAAEVPGHGFERESQQLEPVRARRPQAAIIQVALRLEVALERARLVAEVLGRPLPQLGLAPPRRQRPGVLALQPRVSMNLERAHGARERVVAVDRHDDLEAGAPRGGEEVLPRQWAGELGKHLQPGRWEQW